MDFIQDTIAKRFIDHQAQADHNFIVAGDLNSRWFPGTAGIHGSCKEWADSLSLANHIAQDCHDQGKSMFTRYSGDKPTGHIDHILTYGDLTTTAYGTTNQDCAVTTDLSGHNTTSDTSKSKESQYTNPKQPHQQNSTLETKPWSKPTSTCSITTQASTSILTH